MSSFCRSLAAIANGDLSAADEEFKSCVSGNPIFATFLWRVETGNEVAIVEEARRLMNNRMADVLAVDIVAQVRVEAQ